MEGIETDYKKVVRGSRELPMSSCPSYIEDAMYGSGSTIKRQEDEESFSHVLDTVDAKTQKLSAYYKKPSTRRRKSEDEETRYDRFSRVSEALGIKAGCFSHAVVDVSGEFEFSGSRYVITAPQYEGELLPDGDIFFAMDRVICVDGLHFYDMAMRDVSDFVKKIS